MANVKKVILWKYVEASHALQSRTADCAAQILTELTRIGNHDEFFYKLADTPSLPGHHRL